jgi:hypothetical protein
VAVLYIVVAMVAMFALASLGVDYARVQLVKTELRRMLDAAARAAAPDTADDLNRIRFDAGSIARANSVDGQPFDPRRPGTTLTSTAIDWGGTGTINAVQVDASYDVPLMFARVLGVTSTTVHASAVAKYVPPQPPYGIVGLDSIDMQGSADVDSYKSSGGPYSAATRGSNATLATNGSVTVSGSGNIRGSLVYGTSYTHGGSNGVVPPGTASKISTPLSYPPPALPGSYVSKGDYDDGGKGTLTLGSGTYRFNSVTIGGNLIIAGPVTLYVDGSFNLSGDVTVAGNLAANLRIIALTSAAVNIGRNSSVYADLYAPASSVSVGGTGDFYGRIIARTISLSGNGAIHQDESLGGNASPGSVATVK